MKEDSDTDLYMIYDSILCSLSKGLYLNKALCTYIHIQILWKKPSGSNLKIKLT